MSLEPTLTDIIARLRQGRFSNKQAISQGIVLLVPQELGWDMQELNHRWTQMTAAPERRLTAPSAGNRPTFLRSR
jgi:hypothetical protein